MTIDPYHRDCLAKVLYIESHACSLWVRSPRPGFKYAGDKSVLGGVLRLLPVPLKLLMKNFPGRDYSSSKDGLWRSLFKPTHR